MPSAYDSLFQSSPRLNFTSGNEAHKDHHDGLVLLQGTALALGRICQEGVRAVEMVMPEALE